MNIMTKLAEDIGAAVNFKLAALANPTGGKATGTGKIKGPEKLPAMSPPINSIIPIGGTQQSLGLQPVQPIQQASQTGAATPPKIKG